MDVERIKYVAKELRRQQENFSELDELDEQLEDPTLEGQASEVLLDKRKQKARELDELDRQLEENLIRRLIQIGCSECRRNSRLDCNGQQPCNNCLDPLGRTSLLFFLPTR